MRPDIATTTALSGIDESFLHSFMAALPDACVVIDTGGCVVATNQAWRELPRRPEASHAANDPVGLDYVALFRLSMPANSSDAAIAGIRSILDGSMEQFEIQHIRPAYFGFRWFQMTVRPLRQPGTAAIIFHRDITTEKLAQLGSRTGDQEFQTLADSAPALIWMDAPGKGCTFLNKYWLTFTGVPIEEQLGTGWLKLVHPDDRSRVLEAFHSALVEKSDFEVEYRLWHKDGAYRSVRERGSPRLDLQNQVMGYIGTAWDLSEQKRAGEEALRATRFARLLRGVATVANTAATMREALQQSLDVICETMKFPVGHALLIEDDEPEFVKSSHVVHVKDMQRFAALFEVSTQLKWPVDFGAPGEVLRTGKPVIHELAVSHNDPVLYPRAAPSVAAGLRTGLHLPVLVDGKVEAIVEFGAEEAIAEDEELAQTLMAATERLSRFFERRRAQILLLKKKEELQASAERLFTVAGRLVDSQEEERRRIAREIHDDFTQRLALVTMKIGNLTGRDRSSTAEEIDASLEEIRKSTAAVASDLRDLSHQLHPAMLELLGLVRALQAQCEDFQRIRGIHTTFESSISNHDASQQTAVCLYRVLQEALMNVAKHSGSAVASVRLIRSGNDLVMQVRDEGRGFSVDDKNVNGIGLTNMKERVQPLNGTLTVNNHPGGGAELIARVPASRGREDVPD